MSAVDIIDGRGYILNVEFGGGKDGVDGKDGRDGVAPDLQIGTVKESEDDQPHVTISDEGDGKLSLNFDLVSGQDGQDGEDGGVFIPSVSQEGVISWIAPDGQYVPPVNIKGETGATFTPEVSLGGEISWTNDKGLENPDTRSIKGPKGEKGDPFTIRETYASINDMNADFNNPDIPEGSFVCIASNESDPDNAKMYVKGDNAYVFVTDLSGATGMRGPAGIGIGKVEFTGVETATYKEYGVYDDTDDENLLGTFNLPKGADGHQGSDGVGIRSIVQTTTSHEDDGTNVITVTLTNDNTSTFTVENGSKGSTGAQGPAGQNGQDGQDGVGIDDITVEQSTFDGQANVVTVHLSDETTKTFNVYNGRTGATGTAGILHTNNSTAVSPGPGDESMSNDIRLHKISKTGNYNDLLNKPTIPAAANDSRITIQRNGTEVNYFTLNQSSPKSVNILVPTTVAELDDASSYAKKSDLATVATSGSYYDLDDRPTIGNADLTIRSVDNTTPEGYTEIGKFHANAASPEYITLSKVARTGSYSDLIGIPQYRGTQDLTFDGVFPSGANRVYGVLHQNKKFHFDLIGDYTHISSTYHGTTQDFYDKLMSIATLGQAAYTAIPIPGKQGETYNGYYKIALPLFKKGSIYKLSVTQFIAGSNKIQSIGQTFEYYIKYGDGEDFGIWDSQPSISDGNNTIGFSVETDFDNKLTVLSKPVLIPRNIAQYYRNLVSNGSPFEIAAYTDEFMIKDLSYTVDGVLSNDLSYITPTLDATDVLTTDQLNTKLSTFDGQDSLDERNLYIIDDGDDSDVYALLLTLPKAATIDDNIDDDDKLSDITDYVSSIILSVDAEEVVSKDMYHIPTVNP